MAEATSPPFPPFPLATRVLELPSDDSTGFAFYERFGGETKAELLGLLPEGTDLAGKCLLDFGCGAGRTLRHFIPEAETAEIWGVDIDRRSIDWLQANLCPPLHAAVSPVDPPLGFESGYFDFVWAISIFTHLAENSADWLLELHRVLKPGGLLMATYMGQWNSMAVAGEAWDEDRVGMNELFRDRPWDQGGPMILMSDWWVLEHWGRAFEVVAVNGRFHEQTWAMLRKKDVELTAEELMRPGSDPREWAALRHELTQARGEATSVRTQFESSLSWRLTRPLRWLKARVAPRADRIAALPISRFPTGFRRRKSRR